MIVQPSPKGLFSRIKKWVSNKVTEGIKIISECVNNCIHKTTKWIKEVMPKCVSRIKTVFKFFS
jgi:hypothetical protein